MTRKTFPVEEIKKLLEQNYTIQQLADVFKVSRPTMSKFLKENNLKTIKQKHLQKCQDLNDNEIIALYQNQKTISDIAKSMNVSTQAIKSRLINNNVHIKTNSESHKKYYEDYEYFNTIDNYDKAYLLGFICADGYVTKRHELGIEVAKKDEVIIYWFQSQLKTNKPIKEKKQKEYLSVNLIIQNEKLTTILNEYGIIPNKSLVINIEEMIEKANIQEKLIPAFLLGYFDGDGGIYKSSGANGNTIQYSCSVTGTLETCSYFKTYFNNVGFITKRNKDNKNNYTYQIGGRNMVKNSLIKLYSIKNNLSFFYKRKYNIYCEL